MNTTTANPKFDLTTALQIEAALKANCLTIGRFGEPVEGISLSLDKGPDEIRPLDPHVLIGTTRVHRDRFQGAIFEKMGDVGHMRRAHLHEVKRDGKRPFFTLKNGGAEKLQFSIVRVELALAAGYRSRVIIQERELRISQGVGGTGTVLAKSGDEALVLLQSGQELQCFYPDGGVRLFTQEGSVLREDTTMGNERMLELRIADAKERLAQVMQFTDDERREKAVHAILAGMADILHLSTRFNAIGQSMRITLLRKFFLELSPEQLSSCHKRLTAILHVVDKGLISMLSKSSQKEVDLTPLAEKFGGNVTDMAAERLKREAARRGRQLERLQNRPVGMGGGGKQAVTTNPKKAAKIARKMGQKK